MKRPVVTTSAVAVLLLAAAAVTVALRPEASRSAGAYVEVERKDLVIAVKAEGLLQPVREEAVTAGTWGVIAEMWPNGEPVKAGDVVLRIDDTEEKERLEKDRFRLETDRADLLQAEARAKQQVKEAERAVRNARNALEAAKLNLQELRAGPDPDDLSSAEENLHSAERILALRREELSIAAELAKAGAMSSNELEAKKLAVKRAEIQADKARLNLRKLKNSPAPSDLLAAELEVKNAELNLQAAQRRLESVSRSTQADLERRKNVVKRREMDIQRRERRLKHYVARAPIDGVVVHAPGRWGVPWQPGRFVWKGFKVLSIPDFSRMKAVVNIPENEIPRIRRGAPALVRLPAVPGAVFHGEVSEISELAKDEFQDLDSYSKEKLGRADRQVFPVEIEILEQDERLRSGLSVKVEIIVRDEKRALTVPLAALREDGGGVFASVLLPDGSTEKRPVRIGPSDGTFAVVEKGLREGERVLLSPEPTFGPPAAPGTSKETPRVP